MTNLSETTIADLNSRMNGSIVLPASDEYDHVRKIWNGMIDKRPAMIARCADVADVVNAVNFARDNHLVLAVRGGGHNVAGNSLCNGGMVIDLSQMKSVNVDPEAQRAVVEGGALLADLDAATQEYGLATPVGINSTTGVAGLTLGGGFGWLSRKYGLTVDNLESAEVVLASGEVVQASASENPDLFWALRGGGGNFGIVTKFTYRLHKVGPNLLSGIIAYPIAEAKSVMQKYREFMKTAPDDLTVWVVARLTPPMPFIPTEFHGTQMIGLAILYAGDPEAGETLIAPLRSLGTPIGYALGVQPYTAWQKIFDPTLPPGARNYWKSHNFAQLDDGVIDKMIEYVGKLPHHECDMALAALGGAASRPANNATAYSHRDAKFVLNIHGRWADALDDDAGISWARNMFRDTTQYAHGGVYVNFMSEDEGDRVRNAYGPNYERLSQIKRTYDPHNLFCMNQNIVPA